MFGNRTQKIGQVRLRPRRGGLGCSQIGQKRRGREAAEGSKEVDEEAGRSGGWAARRLEGENVRRLGSYEAGKPNPKKPKEPNKPNKRSVVFCFSFFSRSAKPVCARLRVSAANFALSYELPRVAGYGSRVAG